MKKILVKIILILFALYLTVNTAWGQATNTTAQSWVIADESGIIVKGANTTEIRPIASITKLMTAMVVIDANQDLEELLPRRFFGQLVTRRKLLELAIVKSNNQAAYQLCEFYPDGLLACVKAMNNKAQNLGMANTVFTDPTGLLETNVSTAQDLVKLVMAASNYYVVNEDSNKNSILWKTKKNQKISFKNTNPMAGIVPMKVSKTGWIKKAGGCIAIMAETKFGSKIVVVLGSKSTRTRITEAQMILST